MPQPTISDVLPGSSQTLTSITIPKSALTGLTPNADNPGDQLIAGIVNACIAFYTEARRTGNSTVTPVVPGDYDVSIVTEPGRRSITTNFETNPATEYEEQEIIFRFYKALSSSSFDPDNY